MLAWERCEVAPRARSSEPGTSGAADRLARDEWTVELFVMGRRFSFGRGAPAGCEPRH